MNRSFPAFDSLSFPHTPPKHFLDPSTIPSENRRGKQPSPYRHIKSDYPTSFRETLQLLCFLHMFAAGTPPSIPFRSCSGPRFWPHFSLTLLSEFLHFYPTAPPDCILFSSFPTHQGGSPPVRVQETRRSCRKPVLCAASPPSFLNLFVSYTSCKLPTPTLLGLLPSSAGAALSRFLSSFGESLS